jgi:aspartate 1-decarboxylase
MLREYLFAKIHRCVVTSCDPDYMGSITIDPELLDATGIQPNEKVLVADCDNGQRFETYVFVGRPGSHEVLVNGAAAHLTSVGHRLLVMSFCQLTSEEARRHHPRVVICQEDNTIAERLQYAAP